MRIEYSDGSGSDYARETVRKLKQFNLDNPGKRHWHANDQVKYIRLAEERAVVMKSINGAYRVTDTRKAKRYQAVSDRLKAEMRAIDDKYLFST